MKTLPTSTIKRCAWVLPGNKLYEIYHDREWGVPNHDDGKHFEFLLLESAQAGLSWLTILKRREGYRKAFADFNPKIVAAYKEKQIEELLLNTEIIRNKLKIASAINNAKHFLEIQKEFGSFDNYLWRFVNNRTVQNQWKSRDEIPAFTTESKALSTDLIKRGFSFVGPKVMYAHMQAMGLVNDHTIDCFRHAQLKR